MAIHYYPNKIGVLQIEQEHNGEKRRFNIEIRQGNCLAVFIHTRKATPKELAEEPNGKKITTLYNFFADEQHIKNIMKHNGKCFMDEKVVSIKLNTFYKESYKLLKYFTLSGYKVTCYYKEEKEAQHGWSWN